MCASLYSEVSLNPEPLYARIGAVIDANCFWATEIPVTKASYETSDLRKVLRLEKRLADMYDTEDVRVAIGSRVPEAELRPGTMVAFRVNESSKLWHRGKIISVFSLRDVGVCVRILYVDYGMSTDTVPARNLRELPRFMKVKPRRLAFKLVLGGLRPLSLEFDYDYLLEPLKQMESARWSSKALSIVKDLMSKSRSGLVKVTEWQQDYKGQVHGNVRALGFPQKVYPAEVLIGQKVAFYEKRALFMDLCKESSAAENTRRNLSISGYGPAKKNAWTSPGSMASFDDALEEASMLQSETDITDDTIISAYDASFPKIGTEWIGSSARKPARSANMTLEVDRTTSVWDQYRSAFNTSSTSTSRSSSKAPIKVPAGIDTGKFIEEQKKRVKKRHHGPRTIDELL